MAKLSPALKSILITGASTGIGRGLAEAYAAPGVVLRLSARSLDRLADVKATCEAKGAEVMVRAQDVTDESGMRDWITEAHHAHPLDLVVANAGISGSTSGEGTAEERDRRIFQVNLNGVMNTVFPALSCMSQRKSGQIAIVSSIAGFRGLPTATAYSASKAAVKSWGEGLRAEQMALETGVRINVICPGWVESEITAANTFPMPMIISAAEAASIIKRGLAADKPRIVFPWKMKLASWLLAALPPGWLDPALARSRKKYG